MAAAANRRIRLLQQRHDGAVSLRGLRRGDRAAGQPAVRRPADCASRAPAPSRFAIAVSLVRSRM